MLSMFSPMSLEAQKLITVSIGKINASRVTRSGTSLHRSLLVASVLQKARNVYLDEERERAARYGPPHCSPSSELTVTPICPQTYENNHVYVSVVDTSSDQAENCHEDEVIVPDSNGEESRLPNSEATTRPSTSTTNTITTTLTNSSSITSCSSTNNSLQPRKRRRVSDQETAAAISSILPKRLRSELKDDYYSTNSDFESSNLDINPTSNCSSKLLERLSAVSENSLISKSYRENNLSSSEDTDSESSSEENNTSSSDEPTSPSSSEELSDSEADESVNESLSSNSEEEMEVNQLTSLVSYFSFSKSQQNCIAAPIHSNNSGPHIVALTA